MKKILGLDLGTNSIGWAVVNEAENNCDVYISAKILFFSKSQPFVRTSDAAQ